MPKTTFLASCIVTMFLAAESPAQNTIKKIQVQDFHVFVRISLWMNKAPDYSTSPVFAPRQSIRGELQFHFSQTVLSPSVSTARDSLVRIELNARADERTVVMTIGYQEPFRFNAFYYSPQQVFIVDIVIDGVHPAAAPVIVPIEQAKKSLARLDTSGALLILQRIIAASPMDAAANYHIGLIRLARRDFEMARQNFLRASASDSTYHKRANKKIVAIDKQLLSSVVQAVKMDTTLDDDQEKIILQELTENVNTKLSHQIAGDDSSNQQIIFPNEVEFTNSGSSVIVVAKSWDGAALASPTAAYWWDYAASFSELSSWMGWIAERRALLWRLSAAFAMLGMALVAGHLWSVRKSHELETKQAPPEFASLLANRLESAQASFFDIGSEQLFNPPRTVDQSKKKITEPPFNLPAPLPGAMADLPVAMINVSEQELAGNRFDTIAQRLKVGQGEVELYAYLSRRDATSQTVLNQPRLTMVEVE